MTAHDTSRELLDLAERAKAMPGILAQCHPSLARGRVWCTECCATQRVDSAAAFRHGWPKCCGFTMTIDSPDERRALATQPKGD
jgi:hypothetical protein